jgi:hypothetical protein
VDNCLGLPAEEALIQYALLTVGSEVAQVDQMGRLSVNERLEEGVGSTHLIDVGGQVRVELTGEALEEPPWGGV